MPVNAFAAIPQHSYSQRIPDDGGSGFLLPDGHVSASPALQTVVGGVAPWLNLSEFKSPSKETRERRKVYVISARPDMQTGGLSLLILFDERNEKKFETFKVTATAARSAAATNLVCQWFGTSPSWGGKLVRVLCIATTDDWQAAREMATDRLRVNLQGADRGGSQLWVIDFETEAISSLPEGVPLSACLQAQYGEPVAQSRLDEWAFYHTGFGVSRLYVVSQPRFDAIWQSHSSRGWVVVDQQFMFSDVLVPGDHKYDNRWNGAEMSSRQNYCLHEHWRDQFIFLDLSIDEFLDCPGVPPLLGLASVASALVDLVQRQPSLLRFQPQMKRRQQTVNTPTVNLVCFRRRVHSVLENVSEAPSELLLERMTLDTGYQQQIKCMARPLDYASAGPHGATFDGCHDDLAQACATETVIGSVPINRLSESQCRETCGYWGRSECARYDCEHSLMRPNAWMAVAISQNGQLSRNRSGFLETATESASSESEVCHVNHLRPGFHQEGGHFRLHNATSQTEELQVWLEWGVDIQPTLTLLSVLFAQKIHDILCSNKTLAHTPVCRLNLTSRRGPKVGDRYVEARDCHALWLAPYVRHLLGLEPTIPERVRAACDEALLQPLAITAAT